jgi:hypothetical protein
MAERYPNLDLYLFTPSGNLYKREKESSNDNGFTKFVQGGFYHDPKAEEFMKTLPKRN